MNVKGIPPVYAPEKIVEIAFRHASREARKVRLKNRSLQKKRSEERRVRESARYIISYLTKLEKLKERIIGASNFYKELLDIHGGLEKINGALDEVIWVKKKIAKLEKRYSMNIRMSKGDPWVLRKEFYGKTSSLLKNIKPELGFLANVIDSVKDFPTIKEMFTVVIAGMPNVGKSSLLRELTSSKPLIKRYPFTTKSILVGYIKDLRWPAQIIDTPGVLDRPLGKQNPVERQAILALKELSNLIIFVFDPTESYGFTLKSQLDLYSEINRSFQNLVPVVNKVEAANEGAIKKIERGVGLKALRCSAKLGQVEEVRNLIIDYQKKGSDRALQQVNKFPI
jgi:nucleolar GTP-binding protein